MSDVNAVKKGKAGKRVARRTDGKATGRSLEAVQVARLVPLHSPYRSGLVRYAKAYLHKERNDEHTEGEND